MKRFLCMTLALCLLLCGCKAKTETPPTQAPTTAAPTQATTVPTTVPEETTVPTEVTEPEELPPPVIYRNPLNGQQVEGPWNNRATAVVINNIQAALPQYGISQADILYELETEGGITRFLAVFSDLSQVEAIGPVRSTRSFFNNLALSHDAVLFHCGGSRYGLNGQYSISGDVISGWEHVNEQYNGAYFYRDTDRKYSGYSTEHTLFTSGEKLLKGLADKEFATTYEAEAYDHGLVFAEEPGVTGENAENVKVKFYAGKTTSFQYDAESGTYLASQYNKPLEDAGVDQQLAFRNVIVINTTQSFVYDGTYNRSFYELNSTGEGYLICDGQMVAIQWHRDSLRSALYYTYEDGTPVTLGVGHTYVGVADFSRGGSVTVE